MTLIPYRDRRSAGQFLAERVQHYAHRDALCVLALPRGGVPVGYEVAKALRAPLDVFLVRKLGLPSQPELAIGAVATGGICILNSQIIRETMVETGELDRLIEKEREELERRHLAYRGNRPPLDVRGKTVIVVDDGVATGASMRAAVTALRTQGADFIGAAVPVGSIDACEQLATEVDQLICPRHPDPFFAVGLSYDQFPQLTDQDVRELLDRSHRSEETHSSQRTIADPYPDGARE